MNQFYHKRLPGMDLDVGTVLAVLNPDAYLESGLFLLCNGAVVSRTTYARLFKFVSENGLIRSTEEIADLNASEDYAFGPGDGSTTFSIPNMIGRTIFGGTNVGKYQKEQLPNIYGTFATKQDNRNTSTFGPFYWERYITVSQSYWDGINNNNPLYTLAFDAIGSSSIYTVDGRVKPLSSAFNYIVRV